MTQERLLRAALMRIAMGEADPVTIARSALHEAREMSRKKRPPKDTSGYVHLFPWESRDALID